MKTRHGLFLGFTVLALISMFAATGCGNPLGASRGVVDNALVAKWYLTQATADAGGNDFVFEITAGGRLAGPGFTGGAITVSTSNGRISATTKEGETTDAAGSADYTVQGTALAFSNLSSSTNVFSSLYTASGSFYKKAGSNSGNGGNGGNGGSTNPFLGTWTGSGTTLTVTDTTWEVAGQAKGTYTRNGSAATLATTHYWSYGAWTPITGISPYTATVSGSTLVVIYDGDTMTFTKGSGGGGSTNPFTGTWTGSGLTLTVTDTTWEVAGEAKGTYTRNGNAATLTTTHYWSYTGWAPATGVPLQTASVSGSTLVVVYEGEPLTFTKGSGGGGSTNLFVGTWTGYGGALTITNSTWELDKTVKGTYIRNGNTATLTTTHLWSYYYSYWEPVTGEPPSSATVSGNNLTVIYYGETLVYAKGSGGAAYSYIAISPDR